MRFRRRGGNGDELPVVPGEDPLDGALDRDDAPGPDDAALQAADAAAPADAALEAADARATDRALGADGAQEADVEPSPEDHDTLDRVDAPEHRETLARRDPPDADGSEGGSSPDVDHEPEPAWLATFVAAGGQTAGFEPEDQTPEAASRSEPVPPDEPAPASQVMLESETVNEAALDEDTAALVSLVAAASGAPTEQGPDALTDADGSRIAPTSTRRRAAEKRPELAATRRALGAHTSHEAAAAPAPLGLEFGPDAVLDASADGRASAVRLASLHLRTGQHALARAELEALAGRGRLDEEALLDLAEVRWRTGDLAGAGDAATALLGHGNEAPLALVIAAESVAAAGRPSEASRLSALALESASGALGALDALFAGMPRAAVWPASPTTAAPPPRRPARSAMGEADGAPSTAAEAFAGGRAELARGDAVRAALLLGVAMRLEPGFAEDVLRAVSGRDDQPLLALVRGDALRLLGRETEAVEAFNRARGRASAVPVRTTAHGGPGLFDDDPAIADDQRDG
jgi:hypothetical protein